MDSGRAAILIVDLDKPSAVPSLNEPWILTFNAEVQFHIAVSSEDLKASGLDELGKKCACHPHATQ